MPIIKQTRLHQVFVATRRGDTLVIAPAGDALGFGLNQVTLESFTLQEYAKTGVTKHLIFDLGRSNYFGSMVLGEMIKIGSIVRHTGGRIALGGASRDMQDVLRVMKLDSMWEMFPTAAAAQQAITRLTIAEQLAPLRNVVLTVLAIAALWGLYQLLPRYQNEQHYLKVLLDIEAKATNLRKMSSGDLEWQKLIGESSPQLPAIIKDLEVLASPDNELARSLLFAARDHALNNLQERSKPARHAEMYHFYLHRATQALEGKPLTLPESHGGPSTPGSSPMLPPGAAQTQSPPAPITPSIPPTQAPAPADAAATPVPTNPAAALSDTTVPPAEVTPAPEVAPPTVVIPPAEVTPPAAAPATTPAP